LDFGRVWAEKIISYLNSEVSWKYENIFKFKADITRTFNDQINSSLEECLLDEDIGGFVGTYMYEDVDDIKNNIQIMKNIFGHEENLEIGKMILLQNWNNWNNDEYIFVDCLIELIGVLLGFFVHVNFFGNYKNTIYY
jgi:GTP-sensing pleiotropic transcriptional regulator CodY